MRKIESVLKKKLEDRKQKLNLRALKIPTGIYDFTSNDYLGLARSQKLKNIIEKEYLGAPGLFVGATGSRLLSGNSYLHMDLEQYLAGVFLSEKTLSFNSGYNANLAILSAIPGKDDTIIYDELIHSCIKDGARLSLASHMSFKHNDLRNLERKISKAKGKVFVLVESIYSMDGDACPIQDLVELCKKNGAEIIIDEAHSTGITGYNGNGMACSMGLHNDIFARIYTFGKGMGVHGACIAGSSILIDYLINFSRQFIYTTAQPPHSLISVKCAFKYLNENIYLQDILKGKIELFKKLTFETGITNLIESTSAIQALLISGNDAAIRFSNEIQKRGFDIRPILFPTVKEGSERIRICLHVFNTDDEIEDLVRAIKEASLKFPSMMSH